MTEMYEFEQVLEEFMEYGLGPMLLSNSWSSLLRIAAYVLTSLALYTLAKRRGLKNPWLSWVPVVNCWIIGSLSDQYRYVVRGQVKNKRKMLLILNIVTWIVTVAVIVLFGVMVFRAMGPVMSGSPDEEILELILGPALGILGLCLPMMVIAVWMAVVRYMAMYDIYTSCTPQNNVLFLVLSILFSITEPFFLFFTRNKDEGMPPRKQEPEYIPPQDPGVDPEYL